MLKTSLLLFIIPILTGFSGKGQPETKEYKLKAAFIYNFTKYVEWDTTFSANEFVIGIFGPSPIWEPLSEIARTKTVNDKTIIIRQFNKPDEIIFSHILFISHDVSFPLNEILAKTSVKGTLIICERTGAAAEGSAINFIIINNNLKFEANPKTISSAGLKAGSQLMKLAVLIEGP